MSTTPNASIAKDKPPSVAPISASPTGAIGGSSTKASSSAPPPATSLQHLVQAAVQKAGAKNDKPRYNAAAPRKTTTMTPPQLSSASSAMKANAAPAGGGSSPQPAMSNPLSSFRSPSLEDLMNEKKMLMASFEANFNEKIIARHRELMDEQRRDLLAAAQKHGEEEARASSSATAAATTAAGASAAPAGSKHHLLEKEIKKLKEELEEEKFSHEVELSYQKNRVKTLEDELQRERERKGAPKISGPPPPSNDDVEKRVEELERELRREKKLRIQQLKSLEMLHFAEFREIEKRHAEFVSHLVASYQKEIRVLGTDNTTFKSIRAKTKIIPKPCESKEAVAAAAALSSMASPSAFGDFRRTPVRSESVVDNSTSVAVALIVPQPSPSVLDSVTESSLPESNNTEGSKQEANKNNANGLGDTWSSNAETHTPGSPASSGLKRNITAEIVSSSVSSNQESEQSPRKAKRVKRSSKRETAKQKDQVEGILIKAGKMPPLKDPPENEESSQGKKSRKQLSEETKEYLKNWMLHPDHCDHPYPSPIEKAQIMADTGISFNELNNWFVNNRKRFWVHEVKPRIAEIKKAGRMQKMKESYKAAAIAGV